MRPTFRPVVPLSAFVAIAGAVVLAFAGVWSDGEAVDHARQHASGAVVAGLVAAIVGARWVARLPTFSAVARILLVGSICFFAAAQLAESIGALGYDELNIGSEEWAGDIHELGNSLTTLSLLFVLIGLAAAAAYAATRMRDWRRHPAERF